MKILSKMKKNIRRFFTLAKAFYDVLKDRIILLIVLIRHPTSFKYSALITSYKELWYLIIQFEYYCNKKLIIFGDSVSLRIAKNDIDKRSLGEMLKSKLKDKYNTYLLRHSAYNLEVYSYLTEVVTNLKYNPECIIIPINIRSFSPQWFFKPEWRFEKELREIGNFLNKPYNNVLKTYEEFLETKVHYPLIDLDKIADFQDVVENRSDLNLDPKERKRIIFIYHYLYKIDENHELMRSLIKLIQFSKQANLRIFFYLTPVNIDGGKEYLDESFLVGLQENINQIVNVFNTNKHEKVRLFDYSQLLTKDSFFNPETATEHLNQTGRLQLSDQIIKDFVNETNK